MVEAVVVLAVGVALGNLLHGVILTVVDKVKALVVGVKAVV